MRIFLTLLVQLKPYMAGVSSFLALMLLLTVSAVYA